MIITVWCDDASHPLKRERVFVAEFHKPGMIWMPKPQHHRRHKGISWWSDGEDVPLHKEPDAGEWALCHYSMQCRYCKDRVTLRTGTFDSVMELAARAGQPELTLSAVREIVATSRK
jgi:hypothetical protein